MTSKEFDKQYNENLGKLICYIMRYANISFDDAFDVAQTCSINAYKYLVIKNISISYTFKTFIFTCARNELIDHLRRNKINNKIGVNYSSFLTNNFDHDIQLEDILKIDLTDTTSEKVCGADSKVSLQNYIKSFEASHPEYFSAFTLYSLYDKSYKECAEELNVPIGTIKSRIFKAKSILRDNMPESLKESLLLK